MDKVVYKIIKDIWTHIRIHLQDIDNSSDVSWWDEEGKSSKAIMTSVKDEPEYIKRFTEKLLVAEWELLHAIYRERSGNNDSNRANGDIQQQ